MAVGDELEWWLLGGDWYDRRLRDRVDEANERASYAAASAASDRRDMEQRLKAQSGNLQAQIDRLTRAFVAFVEHEDIRGELGLHAAEGFVRRHARSVVAARLGRASELAPVPPDVPGYWLAAAARALDPTTADPAAELAAAQARDPQRTACFLGLLAVLSRDGSLSGDELAELLPSGPEVTRVEREIWLAVASGALAGEEQLCERLGKVLADAPAESVAAVVETKRGPGVLPQEAAATALSGLRAVISDEPTAPPEPDRLVPLVETTQTGTEGPAPSAADATKADGPLELLMGLVDEGAPQEAGILERMRSVRADMGIVAEAPQPGWHLPAGSVVDLLVRDAKAADPGVRRVARQVLAPLLRREADRLVGEASAAASTTEEARIDGRVVQVGPDGPLDAYLLNDVEQEGTRLYPPQRWRLTVGVASIVVGVLLLLLMLVHPAFVLLALAVVFAGVALLVHHRSAVAARTSHLEHRVRTAQSQIERAQRSIRTRQEAVAAAKASAERDHEAIRAALPG